MPRKFSDETKNLLLETKNIAKRLENNYIGVYHFFLCFNDFNQNGRLKLKVTLSEKKEILKDINGKKLDLKGKKEFVMSKQLEESCIMSGFNSWLMGDKDVEPEHIYLGIIGYSTEQKELYMQLIKEANIPLNWLKKILIHFYFTIIFKRIGKFLFRPF